ncbi:unnamed protein product [Sympodiomycopsis kandeliae]
METGSIDGIESGEEDSETEDEVNGVVSETGSDVGLPPQQCAQAMPPRLPEPSWTSTLSINISHGHLNNVRSPPHVLHNTIHLNFGRGQGSMKIFFEDTWTYPPFLPQWTLEEVEDAWMVNVTGARAAPITPLLTFLRGSSLAGGLKAPQQSSSTCLDRL